MILVWRQMSLFKAYFCKSAVETHDLIDRFSTSCPDPHLQTHRLTLVPKKLTYAQLSITSFLHLNKTWLLPRPLQGSPHLQMICPL